MDMSVLDQRCWAGLIGALAGFLVFYKRIGGIGEFQLRLRFSSISLLSFSGPQIENTEHNILHSVRDC